MKETLIAVFGIIGSFIASLFGGWDAALTTLVVFMAVDYATGLIVAGVFNKSTKTKTGGLESKAGWKGLCRKFMTLIIVLIAYRIDLVTGTSFLKDAVIIAFIINESLSIAENAGLMGVPFPPALKKAIEVLKNKESEGVNNG